MQAKTVKKIIKGKMTEWLSTITDKQLAEDVKDNLLVSGGSIANLLTQEEVNDYDVYLKDKEVLARLAEYYTRGTDLEILKGWKKQDYIEKFGEITGVYTSRKLIAIQNLHEEQIKLYGKEGGLRVNEDAKENDKLYVPMFFSPNAISLTDKVQIVLRFTGTAEKIHKNYDFIHATNYFSFSEGLVLNTKALESLITKQLYYQGSKYPLTSIIRVRKFLGRRWKISAGQLLKIMFQISELDLKNANVLEEQLIGVDVAYFGVLIDILRGKDKDFVLTAEYLSALIEKVFNDEEELDEN